MSEYQEYVMMLKITIEVCLIVVGGISVGYLIGLIAKIAWKAIKKIGNNPTAQPENKKIGL